MRRRLLVVGIGAAMLAGSVGVIPTYAHTAGGAASVAAVKPASTPFVVLKLGSRGDRVKMVQAELVANGATIVADGVFGRKTRAAVRAFQRSKGLLVDGIVGPRTWAALGLDSSDPPPTTTDPPSSGYVHPTPNVQRWHDAALAGGWTEDQWKRLSCIIKRESNGIPTAQNPSGAMGLLQIMWSAHRSWIGGASSQLLDGPTNLRIGHQLYVRSGGWGPWRSTVNAC